ncbi:hypothetical protein SAMIE_1033760 [Sphingobium amiense]|uniref:Dienelactone hydrolase domain-containing protein n=1 Tax=Sphingobium amiense TaxID=135719 RepID=A0A494WG34_9SPHN|nr:dienelactone hydrolase family protein [Sphingobium amiense]BBD99875.1 hypothetical protein SAMIE_1033760 [Sphingobium amiense]
MSNDDPMLACEPITLSDGFVMDAFVDRPQAAPKATVLLLSPIFGVDTSFARTARAWSDAGYTAVAPDYFARVFPGVIAHSEEGFRLAIGRVKAVDRDRQLSDLREIGMHFGNGAPLFLAGYCAGGEPALKLMLEGFGDGCVIFHAARLGLYADRLASISDPLDIHFGGEDTMVPPEEVERVREGSIHNGNIRITVHPGAVHGFTQSASRNYQEAAATASFAAARSFLDAALTG